MTWAVGLDAQGAGRIVARSGTIIRVALGVKLLIIFLEADVVAGNRLMEDRDRQMDGFELDEFFGRHRLAARDAGDIRHGAVDFLDAVLPQPVAKRFGG